MELSICNFLNKLELEGEIMPKIRNMLDEEINLYMGMRLVLETDTKNSAANKSLLTRIDTYLEELKLVTLKFRQTQLALIKLNPNENPEINFKIIKILKKINSK